MSIIRKATGLDTDDIKKIYECAFYGMEGIVESYFKFDEYVEFCLKHRFSYVAIEDDIVCGVLLAYEVPDLMFGKILYVELLAVLPEYQKRKIGINLLNKLRIDAENAGYKEITLRTGCYMNAYEIYKNYGFKDTKTDRRYMSLMLK